MAIFKNPKENSKSSQINQSNKYIKFTNHNKKL